MDNEFKAAVYSRKSKFTGKGESTENQIGLCKEYLKNKYGENYSEDNISVYEDEGFSGSNLNRPEFIKMIAAAENKAFGAIVCYKLDRISRNISDFAVLIDQLEQWGIDFISLKEQFDTSTPMGRAMMYITSVFSQLERETIAERIRDNLYELAKDGRWLGGVTPTGYRSVRRVRPDKNGREKQYFSLEIIPEEAEKIRRIFDIFLECRSVPETLRRLEQNGIRTKNEKPFTPVTLRGILGNPVYAKADGDIYKFFKEKNQMAIYAEADFFNGEYGVMAFRKTLQKPGKANKRTELNHWIVSVGLHKGVVPGKKWIETYDLLNRSGHRARNDYALLSGIVKCTHCGAYLVTKKRPGPSGAGFYYICKNKLGGSCPLPHNLNGPGADAYVWKAVTQGNFTDMAATAAEIKSQLPDATQLCMDNNIQKKRSRIRQSVSAASWNGQLLEIKFNKSLLT